MGVFGKIFMTFEHQFWPDNKQYLMAICEKKGYFPLIRPLKNMGDKPCLCCFIAGDEAKRVERISDLDALKKEL